MNRLCTCRVSCAMGVTGVGNDHRISADASMGNMANSTAPAALHLRTIFVVLWLLCGSVPACTPERIRFSLFVRPRKPICGKPPKLQGQCLHKGRGLLATHSQTENSAGLTKAMTNTMGAPKHHS